MAANGIGAQRRVLRDRNEARQAVPSRSRSAGIGPLRTIEGAPRRLARAGLAPIGGVRGRAVVAGALAAVVIWTGIVAVGGARDLDLRNARWQGGGAAATALALGFGALILALFPEDGAKDRRRWAGCGCATLALGSMLTGFGVGSLDRAGTANGTAAVYAAALIALVAGICFAFGTVPARPIRCSAVPVGFVLVATAAAGSLIVATAPFLPALVRSDDVVSPGETGPLAWSALSGWHWALWAAPIAVAMAAAIGADRTARPVLDGWLPAALVLHAGSQWHHAVAPAATVSDLTGADLLAFGLAATVGAGGMVELRRFAAERDALLARERATLARQADRTALVAHELGSPIAAIRTVAEMLDLGPLDPAERRAALATIRGEATLLDALAADVRTIGQATADDADFAIYPFPVRADLVLADAAAFARTLPGEHPFSVSLVVRDRVRAYPERIAQVLRNLLGNAAKYAPPGTPIALSATRQGDVVRVTVTNHGPGIPGAEQTRIFERCGRGRAAVANGIAGRGLGLYLSRQIVLAHGSDLTVTSEPGGETCFAFDLAVVR
ncbi:MAG: hypothetical protein AVDCRST_MAG73-851 [uncultured Thermomicrobiales bacterium]|uniref:histidine kinase n=1 Tax=uncultured Thermomicrobiales bacterium TaxID=1645740 RepID=A0A6J4TT85_9BACT|nr:MAG: hypothetical protein AVDCRST_MAG73-851 [uncultured Thermomicrobiales bacterium]